FKSLCDPVEDLLPIEAGDKFYGSGYDLEVIHTPGHSAGSCCFLESKNKILFSGDHVINHITPNPLVELNRDQLRDPNYKSLVSYQESLDKIEKLDIQLVFPGHGKYMTGLKHIISRYRTHHNHRQEDILNVLKVKPGSIYSIIEKIFPVVPDSELFLASSDIWAHLEILINGGIVTLGNSGPPEIYQVV
ncbi:MAG: MBL fold metallo-hydrolase, partial [Desulfobacula sp.]|nr:MBL fold metallo-hydrolase [Desulfobacula sp.]